LIRFAGLVAILSLLSKASGLLKFNNGISDPARLFSSILSADWFYGVWGDFAALEKF
jgi:hypothetical protein